MLFHLLENTGLGIDVKAYFVIGAGLHGLEVHNGGAVILLTDKLGTEGFGVVGKQTGRIGDVVVGVGHGRNDNLLVGLVVLPHGAAVAIDFEAGGLDTVARGVVENVHLLAEGLLLVGVEVHHRDGKTDGAGHLG